MAGFFGLFDYTKPGPGIKKDGPPTPRIKLFFEVLVRKIWEIIKLNVLFIIVNLPAIIIAFCSVFIIVSWFLPDMFTSLIGEDGSTTLINMFLVCLTAPIVMLPIVTVGPAQAGMSYILRNYSREEHAFLFSDFKEHAIKNLKQSSIVSIINTILYLLLMVDFFFFFNNFSGSFIGNLLTGFVLLAIIILLMVCMYIYPMMVTFEYTTKELYKNALFFSLGKFIPNLLILAICFILIEAPLIFAPAIGIILALILSFAFISFIINFYVYPKLKKYIMDKIESQQTDKEENEILFSDETKIKQR